MLKRSLCLTCLAVLLLTGPCLAGDKSVSELRQIVQAGGSLILDMSNRRYSVTELLTLAAALRGNATLTIRMDRGGELSTVDCQRLSKSRPGQIRFWF